jgi:hypothetical protein
MAVATVGATLSGGVGSTPRMVPEQKFNSPVPNPVPKWCFVRFTKVLSA